MAANSDSSEDIKVLGVCGGIGSGKSQACQLLVSDLGCVSHIEADSIAHGVYKPGSQAVKDVVAKFGSDILVQDKPAGEEEIDRKKLGAIVFSDPKSMSALEAIVWPHVKTEIRTMIDKIKQNRHIMDSSDPTKKLRPVIVLESAVLLEAGYEDILDAVWVVRAPPDLAIERLVKYRQFAEEDAKKRIEAQKTRRGIGNVEEEVKNGLVTAVIENEGDLDALKAILLEKLNDESAWKR